MSSTGAELAAYLQQAFFPNISNSDMAALLQYYPDDVAAGSPFGTGSDYAFTPQYKRISALHGDWIFQVPRRLLLETYSSSRNAYSFCE